MTRLDHNRAVTQLAQKVGEPVTAVSKVTIWGNHSTTQYPDIKHAEVNGKNAFELVGDEAWVADTFIPTVAKRGAAIIEARGASSAASAANAAVDHVRSWALGTPEGDWASFAVVSDGSYGVPEGLVSGFPVHLQGRRVLDRPGPRHRRVQPRPASTPRSRSSPRSATPSRSSASSDATHVGGLRFTGRSGDSDRAGLGVGTRARR